MALLFKELAETQEKELTITLSPHLEENIHEIFKKEFSRISQRMPSKVFDKEKLYQHSVDAVRYMITEISTSNSFDFNMKEVTLNNEFVTVKDGLVYFPTYMLFSEPIAVDNLNEKFNENLMTVVKTSCVCTILGG